MEPILKKAEEYVENRIEIVRLKTIGKSSEIISSVLSHLILVIIIGISLLILSIGIAFWIGHLMGEIYAGFLIVGGFYAIVGVLLICFRRKWLKQSIEDLLVKKLLE
jgi:membrane protein implicated in regulation of membrane protease activity